MIGTFSRITATLLLASAALVGMSANSALAQGRGGGGMGMMMGGGGRGGTDAKVTSEDIEKLTKQLNLSPEQHDAAKMLFDGYLEAHQKKAQQMSDAVEKIRADVRETSDNSLWQDLGDKMQKFQTEATDAEKGLWTDVKSLLTTEQAASWAGFERSRRREQSGPSPMSVSGERADVIKIIEKIKLPDADMGKLAPVISAYEEELDAAIVKRNDLADKSQPQIRALFRSFPPDDESMTKMDKIVAETREAMIRVSNVNKRYAQQVEGLLAPEQAELFRTEFKKASFPQIYRERYITRAFDALDKLDTLTDEQKSSIAAVKDTYSRESTALAQKGETLTIEQEKDFSFRKMMQGGFGGGGNDAMRDLGDQRTTLEDTTYNKIKAVLTPEQLAKLPERNADNGGRRARGTPADGATPRPPRQTRPAGGGG